MLNIRLTIIKWLLGNLDFILVVHRDRGIGEHDGAVVCHTDVETEKLLQAIIASGIENKEEIKSIVLGGAKKYLSRYEIDARNFAREIYPNK